MSSIKRTFNLWLFILIQAKNVNKPNLEARDQNTLDIFTKLTDAQRHLFANKLSELPEMVSILKAPKAIRNLPYELPKCY
jgi:hypothetical protein